MVSPRVRLGELLVKSGLLTQEQLSEALDIQKRDGRRLGTLLVELGLVSETQVTQILSQQLSVPWVSLHHIDFSQQLLNLVPQEVVERYCLVPIYVRRVRGLGDALYVAMDDPSNEAALKEVAQHSGLHVRAMIAPPSDIRAAIVAYYGASGFEEDTAVHRRAPLVIAEPANAEGARAPQQSGVDLRVGRELPAASDTEAAETRPGELEVDPEAQPPPASSPEPSLSKREEGASGSGPPGPRATNMPNPEHGRGAPLIAVTLLDGTKINLPARSPSAAGAGKGPESADRATARDLIAALRQVARGAEGSEVLGEEVRWEAMFAALLSLLLRKHLIADWEFIEEYKKS